MNEILISIKSQYKNYNKMSWCLQNIFTFHLNILKSLKALYFFMFYS